MARTKAKTNIIIIFFFSLTIRSVLFLYIVETPEVILQPDSKLYLSLSQGLKENGLLCYCRASGMPIIERMPGYPGFIAVTDMLGGGLLSVVFIQIVIDSFSCVLIYFLGERVRNGSGFLCGALAAVNIGMITYSHFILNDSLFLFFLLLLILVIIHFFHRPVWLFSLLMGAGAGFLVMIRPVILYFPLFFIPFQFLYLITAKGAGMVKTIGQTLVLGLAFILILSPWLIRNYKHYGQLVISTQSGEHLMEYVIPFVWQYSKGIPFIEGMKKINNTYETRAKERGFKLENISPVKNNELKVDLAMDYMKKEPVTAICKAWIAGMAKNLFAPATIDLSYLLKIERPHFFYTEGKTLIDRTLHFLKSIRGFFGWIVIGNIFFIAIVRLLQLYGLILLVKENIWKGLFFALIVTYFLVVSGPVGYTKYRLPFEPILIVLLAIGLKDIYERFIKRQVTSDK